MVWIPNFGEGYEIMSDKKDDANQGQDKPKSDEFKWGWLDFLLMVVGVGLFVYIVITMWRAKPENVDFAKFLSTVVVSFGAVAAGWVLIRMSESHKGNVSVQELIGAVLISFGTLYFACAICPGYVQSIIRITSIIQEKETDPPEVLVAPVMSGTPAVLTAKELTFTASTPKPDKIVVQMELPGDTVKITLPARKGKVWYHFNANDTTKTPERDSLYTAF